MSDLKNKILSDYNSFVSANTREEKQKQNLERKKDNISYNYSRLLKIEEKYDILRNYLDFSSIEWNNMKPEIVFCSSKKDSDIWTYLRHCVSSLIYTGYYGRSFKYYIRDSNSGCILGILGLGSDFMSLSLREGYIGWSKKDKFGIRYNPDGSEYNGTLSSWSEQKKRGITIKGNKINNLMNIFTCVSLNPVSDLTFGKMCAISCFSNEVLDYFKNKYGEDLAGLTTTSIYGKSIQYDRIPFLKYLGLSKGVGTVQFSKTCVEMMRNYYSNIMKRSSTVGLQPKAKMIKEVLKEMGFSSKYLKHEHVRGIYFGFTHKNSKDFLCGKIGMEKLEKYDDRNFEDLFKYWKKRYMVKRLNKNHGRNKKIPFYYDIRTYSN